MGRKKKAFIDKRRATTYTLVYEDNDNDSDHDNDDGDDDDDKESGQDDTKKGSGDAVISNVREMVERGKLKAYHDPSAAASSTLDLDEMFGEDLDDEEAFYKEWRARKENSTHASASIDKNSNTLSEEKRREILLLGLPDDGYDYLQHLRTLDTPTSSSTSSPNASNNARFVASSRPRAPQMNHEELAYTFKGEERNSKITSTSPNIAVDDSEVLLNLANQIRTLPSIPNNNKELAAIMAEMDRIDKDLENNDRIDRDITISDTSCENVLSGREKQSFVEYGNLNDDFIIMALKHDDDATSGNILKTQPRPKAAADSKSVLNPTICTYKHEQDVEYRFIDECFENMRAGYHYESDEENDLDFADLPSDVDDEGAGIDLAEFHEALDEYLDEMQSVRKYQTEMDENHCGNGETVSKMTEKAKTENADSFNENDRYTVTNKKQPYREIEKATLIAGQANTNIITDVASEPHVPFQSIEKSDDKLFEQINSSRELYSFHGQGITHGSVAKSVDIESVVSFKTTVSTPSIIPMVRTLGVPQNQTPTSRPKQQIQLSAKTGLPIGYHPASQDVDDSTAYAPNGDNVASESPVRANNCVIPARPAGKEDPASRRTRKSMVKAMRREKRAMKKQTKIEFKSNEMIMSKLKDNPPTIQL